MRPPVRFVGMLVTATLAVAACTNVKGGPGTVSRSAKPSLAASIAPAVRPEVAVLQGEVTTPC